MTNEITSLVSSLIQHCFASDKKETSPAFVASKGEIMNQKRDIRWNILTFNFGLSDYYMLVFVFMCIKLTFVAV